MAKILECQKVRLTNLIYLHHERLFKRSLKADEVQYRATTWKGILDDVNRLGVVKTLHQWKNCWATMKKKANDKIIFIRQYRQRTGRKSNCPIKLADYEQAIISITNDGLSVDDLCSNQTLTRCAPVSHEQSPSHQPNRIMQSSNNLPLSCRMSNFIDSGGTTHRHLSSSPRRQAAAAKSCSSFDTAFFFQQPVSADQDRYRGLSGSQDTISNVSGRHTNSISQRNSSTRIGHSRSSHRSSSTSRASIQRSRSRSLLNSNDRNLISNTSSRSIDEGHRSRSILSSISGFSANSRNSISILSRRDSHSSSRRISTARSEETNGQASRSFDTAFSFQQPSRADQDRYRALSGSRDTISNVSGRRTNSISQRSSSTRIGHISRSHRSSSVSRASINGRSSISNMSRGSTYSGRSFQSDSQLSGQATQSRRNLTATLARSVQNAAVVQQNTDRNILSLRDGQEEIVTVLRECLDELRRRNDFPNEFSLRNT